MRPVSYGANRRCEGVALSVGSGKTAASARAGLSPESYGNLEP